MKYAEALEQKRQENNWRRTQARFARQKAADELVQANRRNTATEIGLNHCFKML